MKRYNLALIIASNRQHKDYEAQLPQLLASSYLDHLILVNKYPIDYSTHPKLTEIIQCKPGASKARNLAIQYALGTQKHENIKALKQNNNGSSQVSSLKSQISTPTTYFAFTDDDCIIDKNWLQAIHLTLDKYPEINLLFGQTKSYQPEFHINETCPCTFSKTPSRFSITTKPCRHWEEVGFSNNMAIRAEVFQKLGSFKEWLGPGSIGSNCEDGELINRSLISDYKIGYEPNMLIFHNKWLNPIQKRKQDWSYTCGEMACYGLFAMKGHQFAKKIVGNNLKYSYYQLRQAVRSTLTFKSTSVKQWLWLWYQLTAQLWGLGVAFARFPIGN